MKLDEEASNPETRGGYLFKCGTSQHVIDSEVWNVFKQGDRKALDYIFEKYVRLLYAYGAKITENENLVEDSIQDLFIELWRKRNEVSSVTNIKFYLLKSLRRRIVRNISAIRELYMAESALENCEANMEFSAEFKLIQEQTTVEQRENLRGALKLLTKRQREAIYLKFYEKVSYSEMAEIMNIEIKSAYNLIGKAIDTLRSIIRT